MTSQFVLLSLLTIFHLVAIETNSSTHGFWPENGIINLDPDDWDAQTKQTINKIFMIIFIFLLVILVITICCGCSYCSWLVHQLCCCRNIQSHHTNRQPDNDSYERSYSETKRFDQLAQDNSNSLD